MMLPGGCDMNPRSNKNYTSVSNQGLVCSQQSILSAMERFVKSINNMDATVLVPSKLRDMSIIGMKSDRRVPTTLTNTNELHNFYLMLNDVKKELLWGTSSITMAQATSHEFVFSTNSNSNPIFNRSNSVQSSTIQIKHSRQSSQEDCLGSMESSISSNASDTESDADSMITDRDSIDDPTSHLFVAFRHHLQGLNSILHQLADSADYLSSRYQEEIEDS